MKKLAIALILSTSSGAHALSNTKLISVCKTPAATKLRLESEIKDCSVEYQTMKVIGLVNRPYTISRYVWFSAEGHCKKSPVRFKIKTEYDSFSDMCF